MTFVKLNSSNQPEVLQTPLSNALVFTMPATFSPGCSNAHFPSILEYENKLLEWVESIYVVTYDNIYSLEAWKKSLLEKHGRSETRVQMLSDVNLEFGKRINIIKTNEFLGTFLKRTASYINDSGEVEWVVIDELKMDKTSGREILQKLQSKSKL